jgi:hypothetical protein
MMLHNAAWQWGFLEISLAGTMAIYSSSLGAIANGNCYVGNCAVTFHV